MLRDFHVRDWLTAGHKRPFEGWLIIDIWSKFQEIGMIVLIKCNLSISKWIILNSTVS